MAEPPPSLRSETAGAMEIDLPPSLLLQRPKIGAAKPTLQSRSVLETEEKFLKDTQVPASPSVVAKDIGVEHFKRGAFHEAYQCFTRAVAADDTNWQAWNNLVLVCLSAGRNDEALGAADSSLRAHPTGGALAEFARV